MSLILAPKVAQIVSMLTIIGALFGCKTTDVRAAYVGRAVYSADFRGYVLYGRDADTPAVVLRDLGTYNKVRCYEVAQRWAAGWGSGLRDTVHDQGWSNNTFGYMFPFALVFLAIGGPLYGIVETPYLVAQTPSANSLFHDAMEAFRRRDYVRAAGALERARMRGGLNRQANDYADYYLGLAYEQLGREDQAGDALLSFVRASSARDRSAYDEAEGRLSRLGVRPIPNCNSQAPVSLPWDSP